MRRFTSTTTLMTTYTKYTIISNGLWEVHRIFSCNTMLPEVHRTRGFTLRLPTSVMLASDNRFTEIVYNIV